MNDWIEITAKTVDEAILEASLKLETSSDKIEYEIIERETKGILGIFSKDAKIRAKCKFSIEKVASNFLEKIFNCMNIDASVDILYDEDKAVLDINMKGNDMGVLIGKRGQTLDSLQYLTSLVVNKESTSYVKVKVDTENYRERRKDTLENLANNISRKVKRTRKPVSLEPMNPYERRIIHSALQNDRFVETHSEGDEPYRKIVITPKRNQRDYYRRNNSYKRHDYGKKDYKKKFKDSYKKSYQSITFDDIYSDKEEKDKK